MAHIEITPHLLFFYNYTLLGNKCQQKSTYTTLLFIILG